jgi:hypothetical protein
MTALDSRPVRVITADRAAEFEATGLRPRRFFPHRAYALPKCGPDGFRLAEAMAGLTDPGAMWQIVIYADDSLLEEFPRELFFDDELNWHREQFGMPGQIGSASLVLDGSTVWGITYVSDLVQRIALRREHKTRVEKVFEGWRQMLMNAVLAFALERGATRVRTPASRLAMQHTDPARRDGLGPEMYERIYDRTVTGLYPAVRDGDWWVLEAERFRDLVVRPEPRNEAFPAESVVCVCHDTERGLGHTDVDSQFAREADLSSPAALERMLEVEAEAGVRTTYSVVGSLLSELQEVIESGGHALAFHSFDHRIEREDQLARCREVDYRIKGYRPPRSEMTPELSERNLLFHNFEWLATSRFQAGLRSPAMRSGIALIPIESDDFAMHSQGVSYEDWQSDVLSRTSDNEAFTVIGLHDCYAGHWLPRYGELLARLEELGELRTLDEVAAGAILASAA